MDVPERPMKKARPNGAVGFNYCRDPRRIAARVPGEKARYRAAQGTDLAQVFVDSSYVRFFSLPEVDRFARRSGFRVQANYLLPRNQYKRNYAVLERVS